MKIQKPSPLLQQICQAAFPGYRGRKWSLESRTEKSCLSYWDGGSKDSFCYVNISTMFGTPLPDINPFQPMPPKARIDPGFCIVESSVFMSKQSGLTVHCHPEDLERLKAGCVEKT